MARQKLRAQTPERTTGDTSSNFTILQIVAPVDQSLVVTEWCISFPGTTLDEPIRVDVLRLTSAGNMTALTPKPINVLDDVNAATHPVRSSALVGVAPPFNSEPSYGGVLATAKVSNRVSFVRNLKIDEQFIVTAGGRLGIRVNSTVAVNAVAYFDYEE